MDAAGKPTRHLAVGCRLRRLPQLPPGLRVLQGGVHKRKGQKKDQKRKEKDYITEKLSGNQHRLARQEQLHRVLIEVQC